jgi:hypothetical protein
LIDGVGSTASASAGREQDGGGGRQGKEMGGFEQHGIHERGEPDGTRDAEDDSAMTAGDSLISTVGRRTQRTRNAG